MCGLQLGDDNGFHEHDGRPYCEYEPLIGCVLFQNLTNLDRSRFVRPVKKNTQIFVVIVGVVILFSSAQSDEDHTLFYYAQMGVAKSDFLRCVGADQI